MELDNKYFHYLYDYFIIYTLFIEDIIGKV